MTYTPNKITGLDRVRDMMDKTNAIMDALSELQLIPGAGVVVDGNHIFSVTQSTDAQTLGGLEPTKFVQVVLSETTPTTGLYEGLEWLKPSTGEIKAYAGGEFKSVGGGVLTMYSNHVILNSDSATVTIGIPAYMRDRDSIIVAKNGQPMYNGIDFSVSADSLNLEIIIHSKNPGWYANDDFYIWVLGTADVSSDILATTVLISSYTALTSGITNVPINNVNYNPTNDILQVSMSGIILDEVDHYTKNPNGISIDLVGWSLDSGDKIVFRVQKKVRTDITTLDGATISSNSINNGALGTDIKIGSLSLLPTVNKIDVVSAITEVAGSVDTKISALVNSSPATLDTLKELAYALGDDPNYATTTAELIGSKASQADFDSHQAETATETVKGHIELATAAETTTGTDDTRAVHPAGLKVELDKKLSIANYNPKDVDNGRFQAQFGFDGAVYSSSVLLNNAAIMDVVQPNIEELTSDSNVQVLTGTSRGERIAFSLVDIINYIEVKVATVKQGTPNYNCSISIYDETSSTLVGTSQSINTTVMTLGAFSRFVFTDGLRVARGHTLQIRLNGNGGDASNYILFTKATTGSVSNANSIYSINNWTSVAEEASSDLTFKLNYSTSFTSGTVTKTTTPSDLKKYGNLKWTQTTPANTSAVCDMFEGSDYGVANSDVAYVSTAFAVSSTTIVGGKFTSLKATSKVKVKLKFPAISAPSANMQVHIYSASGSNPDISLGNAILPPSTISQTIVVTPEVEINLTSPLTVGGTYFVVLITTGTSWNWALVNGITGGNTVSSTNGGTIWTATATSSMWFQVADMTPLKSNVASIADLSDIDATTYPSLKTRWTLTRNSITDESPTVSDPSWTWEGKGSYGIWEEIANVTLPSDTAQVNFENLGLENYKFLQIRSSAKGSSPTVEWNLQCQFNGDTGNNYYDQTGTLVGYVLIGKLPMTGSSYHYSVIDIINFTDRSKLLTILHNLSGQVALVNKTGAWNNSVAKITKISLYAQSLNLRAGSTFILLGVK